MYAGLGETISERAGVINLGTEGSHARRRARRVRGHRAAPATRGSGCSAGRLAGALLALVHAILVVNRGANQFASGLTISSSRSASRRCTASTTSSKQINAFTPYAIPGAVATSRCSDRSCSTTTRWSTSRIVAVPPSSGGCSSGRASGLLVRTAGERSEALGVYGVQRRPSCATGRRSRGGALAGIGGAQLSIALRAQLVREHDRGPRLHRRRARDLRRAGSPLRMMAGAYLFGAALVAGLGAAGRGRRGQPVRARRPPVRADPRRARSSWAGARCSPPRTSCSKVFDNSRTV